MFPPSLLPGQRRVPWRWIDDVADQVAKAREAAKEDDAACHVWDKSLVVAAGVPANVAYLGGAVAAVLVDEMAEQVAKAREAKKDDAAYESLPSTAFPSCFPSPRTKHQSTMLRLPPTAPREEHSGWCR